MFYSPSTKGFYDDTLGYTSLPEDIIEVTKQQYNNMLNGMYNDNKDVVYENDVLRLVDKVDLITWDRIRYRRDFLLKQSDYTQLSDWPGNKNLWIKYRQELRDIPQKFSDPMEVIWPEKPNA